MSLFTRLRRTRIYKPGMNNALPKRLNWEQIENRPRQEGRKVVKGTTKRVIVVKSPDPKIFEQAAMGAGCAGIVWLVLRLVGV